MRERKILLLENVATQAAGVREHLAQAGFEVAVSRYEADGLKRLVEWAPDLVLVSTAHPAGDFGDYCRRVRALGPGVRIVVTSPLSRERLFQEHPGLQAIIDGVLQRPFSHEEVAALFTPTPDAPSDPAEGPAAVPGDVELRAEFQRQLDARFLEVQELKRHLEVASRRAASAPGLEWLQSENEHLRQGVEEARKKAALALATEQLKRSEIEVKLDNLLRMKEDFEFRAENELEDRSRELERLGGELQELRKRSEREAEEQAALRVQLEHALVEKEQIEERLHALESGGAGDAAKAETPPEAAPRIAELEAEVSRQRAQVAEGQVVLADVAAKAAVLEASLASQQAALEERGQLLAQAQTLREREAEAQAGLAAANEGRTALEKELVDVRQAHAGEAGIVSGLKERLTAAEASVAEAQAGLAAANEGRTALEKELAAVRQARAGEAGFVSDLKERLTAAEASVAEAQAGLAAASEGRAALEKELAEVRQARAAEVLQAREHQSEFAAQMQELLERAASAERRNEQLQSACTEREERLAASEAARISAAAAAGALVEQSAAEVSGLRARAEGLNREIEPLRAFKAKVEAEAEKSVHGAELLGRELGESRDRVRELATECERLTAELRERERVLAGEVRTWRDRAEAAALETRQIQEQGSARASREEDERRTIAERLEQAGRELAEREVQIAALRAERAAAAEARRREGQEFETRVREAEAASREARDRLAIADAALVAASEDFASREREARLQLEALRVSSRELEETLAARTVPEAGAAAPLPAELHRIQELLEEVISRARTEAVDDARRNAELSARLQTALEERRLLQERFDRSSAEAIERERRSSVLLQSAFGHSPAPQAERANLPAVVPLDPAPTAPRRRVVLAGLALVALAVLLAVFGLHRATPPAVRERAPAVSRRQPLASPAPTTTPREVWDRWTRSDSSGGVLVQATLRSEQQLRAEVEAGRARGMSDEDARAELERRLSAFRFGTTYYVTVYLKNLAPGYPAYLDGLPGHFRLRDSSGKEVPAFLPPGQEWERRIFSFAAGTPGDLIYEASVSLGFDRAGLSSSVGYLQLVVSDVGAASRRVLTWELE